MMENMTLVEPNELSDNVIELIGKEWMLVAAGDESLNNAMTVSWGSIGYFFNKNVATIVVRPERFTYEILERESRFSLTILMDGNREALAYMGKVSGRDCDKIAGSGLTPIFTESGLPTFKQARLVLECRKIYSQMMTRESFVDADLYEKWYNEAKGNPHKLFMGEIERCWIRE